jgi:hypothetical protein
MMGEDHFLQRFQLCFCGLEQDENLRARFQFAPPPVIRFDPGDQIGAGNEAGFEGGFG